MSSSVQGLPYCRKAREMVTQLQRAEWLDAYNDDARRQVIAETKALYDQNKDLIEAKMSTASGANPFYGCTCFLYHNCILRNKRCLMAYHQARVAEIQDLRWKTGSVVPPDLKPKLCDAELKFFSEYDKLVSNYMENVDVDLTADMTPPKQLLVGVRVLQDCGDILTESGPLHLKQGTSHFVRRSDVEHLIRQNMLEQVA